MTVHRDLEDLISAWENCEFKERATCLIHVGFDRPLAKQLEHLVGGYAGKVLVTGSAKYSLPSSFKTSMHAVALVDELPIFLGLKGWGYIADEVEKFDHKHGSDGFEAGWLRSYVVEHPDAIEHVSLAQIKDDETYLEYEHILPRVVRSQAGAYRFVHLTRGKTDDPCKMAACVPPWLSQTRIESMGLPARVKNVFHFAEIQTVSDLAKWNLNDLLKVQNFGRKCIDDVRSAIARAIRTGFVSVDVELDIASGTDLLTSIHRSLDRFTDREKDVVRRRMGLSGLATGAETLQEIADDYGLTRERIRQIESKVTKRLVDEELWDDIFAIKIRTLVTDREFPLPLLGIEASDSWFRGVSQMPDAVEYMLANMCNSGVSVVTIEGSQFLAFVSQESWEGAMREARKLLASGVGKGWTYSHCRRLIDGLLTEDAREFRGLLWDISSKLCHFTSRNDGEKLLSSFGRGAEQLVEAVLSESQEPLHFTEIAKRASSRSNRVIDVRRAHNAAASVGILLGRGIYGLQQHLRMPRSDLEHLSDAAEAIVSDGSLGRQWHTSELLAELVDQGCIEVSNATKYILNFALKEFSGLTDLNRMIWTREDSETFTGARIDVHQAVLAVLQQSDRPLRTTEIRQRIVALRGVNGHFQIHARDPLLRVGTALWGINDRDVPLKRADQPDMLNSLLALLEEHGYGIHVSELILCDVPSVVILPPESVCCLASEDSRFRISYSQYIYLSDWEGPRRLAITEAVTEVLREANSSLTLDEVTSRTSTKVGRVCERVTISSCLHIMEAETDASGRWLLGASANRNDEEEIFPEITEASN